MEKNKDYDPLPQINLVLLFGEESNLPFYYRKLPGNITDVKTVKNLLADMKYLGYDKIKLVMDRGFYSEANENHIVNTNGQYDIKTYSVNRVNGSILDEWMKKY